MTYYHLADEVDFRLDPDFRPQNNTTMGGDYRPGIFVSGDPYGVSHWCQMYGYWRPWVVEFEGSVRGVEGGYGNEVFIPAEHFDKLRVSRVVPLDAFCRELYQDWGWTESYYETTFDTEEPIASHPGGWGRMETPEWKGSYRYPGDARRASSSWRSQYEDRIRRYQGEMGGIVSNRRTAASSPGTLYRGLAVPFSEAQLEDVMDAYGKESFVGRVLGYLSRGFFTPNREWGLGKHWTTNINVAKSFSQNGFGTPVVLVAEWDGSGEDPYNAPGNNFGGEDEVTLLPETELRLVDVLWGPTFESIGGSGRTITAGGSLPPGLRMESPKPNQVVAYDDDNPDPWLSRFGVGVLSWDDDGVISWVAIQDDSYKRRGVATAMLEYARTIRPDIKHSDELSESGAGWAQAVGSRTAGTEYAPGPVYRGINTDMLTDDELDEIEDWAAANAYSQNNYQLAEPNYGLIHRIVDRFERSGLGRHWSKDYDVSADFARDQGDNIAIIFIGDWDGQGVDDREFHRGWDGVQRPSNVEHEKEVTLLPGSKVTLVGLDIVMPNGFTSNIPVPTIQVTASRTAANDLRVHLFDSEGHEMFLEPDFEGNPWTYHPKVMQAVRFLADVAQSNGVYWHMDHNEWIPSTITDFKVFDGPNDVTHEIKEFPQLRGRYASRTAAEPGGVLPWNPSHRGYTWITHSDGTLEAVTNDAVNRMFLTEEPWGWEWEVFDSLGFVEGGTFGMALKGGDALRQRANELLSEFDTRAEMRTRGPSRGYQDDYTPAPNTLWSKREAWSNSPWVDHDFENPTYAPYGPLTLYRGFSFEANPGVADQLLERLKSGEPVVKVFEDALIESRYSAMQFGDRVGVYWSTDKDYALNLAMVDSNLDDHVGLYIQAHWEGGDHDINFGKSDRKNYWGNESEVRLLPGTDVKGLEVGIYVGGRWHTSGTGQSFTAERTSPSSARKTTSQRYAERLRREGRR